MPQPSPFLPSQDTRRGLQVSHKVKSGGRFPGSFGDPDDDGDGDDGANNDFNPCSTLGHDREDHC